MDVNRSKSNTHNIDMRIPPITPPVAQLVRTPKLHVRRSLAQAPKQGTRTRARYIELPRKLWDRIILFMFTCSLFTFLHAFFGFGAVREDLDALNDTFVLPRTTLCSPSPWNRGSAAPNGDQEIRTRGVTQVMVDWHGDYGLLSSTTSALVSPASIPQDAFLDPTPALVRARRERTPDEGPLTVITKAKTPADTPFAFYGAPYDPFRLEFESSVDRGQLHGPYLIAGQPRVVPQAARTRRFGRCLPEDVACL